MGGGPNPLDWAKAAICVSQPLPIADGGEVGVGPPPPPGAPPTALPDAPPCGFHGGGGGGWGGEFQGCRWFMR